MDYVLTALVPLLLFGFLLYGSKATSNQDAFMSKDYTTVLKAVCCIIVILVHIPEAYQNKLQDGIGSFAYVCVTFFFLISAYGMSLSIDKKKDYMEHFWRNRLAALLIPPFLIVVGGLALLINTGYEDIYRLNFSYVGVLLAYCLLFWVVYLLRHKISKTTSNMLLIGGVIVSSLISYFCFEPQHSYWCFERWGLVWGVLLLLYMPTIKRWITPSISHILVYGVIGLVLGAAYLLFKPVYFYGAYLLKVVLGISLIIFAFTLSSKRIWGNKCINYLGNISYEVYLSHDLIMIVLSNYFPKMSSGIFIVTTILSTILFSAIIHAIGKPIVKRCRS